MKTSTITLAALIIILAAAFLLVVLTGIFIYSLYGTIKWWMKRKDKDR